MLKGLTLKSIVMLLAFSTVLTVACNGGATTQKTTSSATQNGSPQPTTQPIWTPPLVLHPITPPEGSVSLPGGIKITPSVASPWPDVPVYEDVCTLAEVKTGDEFSIGLDISPTLGVTWVPDYDESVFSLVAKETAFFDDAERLGTKWFRFKAITEDCTTTSITLDLVVSRLDNEVLMRLHFGVNVVK